MSSPGHGLNEKEAFYHFYDNAPCGFHSLDKDSAFLHVNDTELRWLGYARDELIGKRHFTDLLAPESIKPVNDAFRDFILHGNMRDLEVHLLRKDGSILPVLMNANAVRDLQGNLVMSHSILYDITGREQAEQMSRRLLEATPDPMLAIDGDGRIALVNAQAEKMFGYSRKELLGQKIEVLIPERFRSRHPGHRTDYQAQPKVRPMGAGLELYGQRKDGEEFPVEINLSPFETEEGPLVFSSIRDATERKRMVEALRISEERFRVALQNSPVVVFNQDQELRYTWINSPVLAWAEKGYLGRTDEEIIGAEMAAPLTAVKQGVLRSGIGTRTEVTITYMGEARQFDLTVEPLRDAWGVIVGVTCAATDISSLRQAAVKLERLNRLRTQFLDMAAHDLRNPIGSILLLSECLGDEAATVLSEEQLKVLSGIRTSSKFMTHLIDDFLDMSSLESGNVHLSRRPSDPRKLLERNVGYNAKLARQKQIQVGLHIEGALPQLMIDEERIEQVLNNLTSNAVKFSQIGTAVEVRAAAHDGGVLISIRDQGPGIPEAEHCKLFEPFGRTSVRSTAGERSTGLGLAISRKIVEGHGGRIWVESQVGVGSLFLFTLPA